FKIKRQDCDASAVANLHFPCLVLLKTQTAAAPRPALLVQHQDGQFVLFTAGTNTPSKLTQAEFEEAYCGTAFQLTLAAKPVVDPDQTRRGQQFGFRWFIPE